MIINPTPYPDVNSLLQELLLNVQAILGDQLVGMYLDGSLATGDYDEDSDVDFVAIMKDELTDDLFKVLKAMHERISVIDTPLAIQLEGTYISAGAVRRYDPRYLRHANLERGQGERLKWVHYDGSWIVHRYVLRERGITLVGPVPRTLIDPVLPADLRQAMRATLDGWVTELSLHPEYYRTRGYQSYIVLTLCRILYTLQEGRVASKPIAARWGQETQGEPWAALIERAWFGRHHSNLDVAPEDAAGTTAFIRFLLERGRSIPD